MKGFYRGLILFPVIVLSLLMPGPGAHAGSVEFLAGGGDVDAAAYLASYYHARINYVLPLSRRFEAFGGLEYIRSDNAEEDVEYRYERVHDAYSFYIPGAGFGLRLKPFAGKRFQFYVTLGALAGKVYYQADFSKTNLTAVSSDRGSTYFISPRFGWGVDFRFNKQLAAVFETSAIASAPAFNVVVANNNTGAIEDRKLNESGHLFGALIGLKYFY